MKIEGKRPTDETRVPVADMIEAAAERIGADVCWHGDAKYADLRNSATLTLDGQEVCVEAVSPKLGARIESYDRSREWYYETAAELAKAVRRRARGMKKRDAAEEVRRAATHARDLAEMAAKQAAEADLKSVFGEDIVDGCVSLRAKTFVEGKTSVTVDVHCGRISAEGVSVAQAVRFIQVLITAGYDLLAEQEKLYPTEPPKAPTPPGCD